MNRLLPLLLLLSAGCLDLDGLVYNPVHCSTVGPDTCGDESGRPYWDQVCVPCEEAYPWDRDYAWMDTTLDAGVPGIRPIDPATVQDVGFSSEDGAAELDAYLIPSHGENAAVADLTILYAHGNYAGIEHYLPNVRMLHEAGYAVLAWDYRGYGKSSEGTGSAEQFMADAATVRALAEDLVADPDKLVLYGKSLGALPSVESAVADPPCALMLEVPFTSMSRISQSNSTASLGEDFFSKGLFDNVGKLEGYGGPLLVMAAGQDNFFPLDDVTELYEAAAGPKELVVFEDAKHGVSNGGIPEVGLTPYFEAMQSFLADTSTCGG